MTDESDLDEIDRAFVDSIIPTGAMGVELFAVIRYMDAEGVQRFQTYSKPDQNAGAILGLIELGKARVVHAHIHFVEDDD